MEFYIFLKWVHIISSTLLFGTGIGTAFHGWMSHRSGDLHAAAAVGRSVVLADWLFTTPTVIIQPVTGLAMVWLAGYPLSSSWLVTAIVLYFLVGACWMPVVWIQIRMHRMVEDALRLGAALPPQFHRYAQIWFILGWPAFISMLAIFWLMVRKPALW